MLKDFVDGLLIWLVYLAMWLPLIHVPPSFPMLALAGVGSLAFYLFIGRAAK